MHDFDKLGIATALHCQVALFDTYHCFSHPKSESRKGLPFHRMLLQSAEQSLIPPPSSVQAVPKHNNMPDSCWAGNSLSLRENCILRFQARRLSKARDWVGTAQIERDLGIGAGCLSRWKRKLSEDDGNAFPGHGHLTPEQEHIRQLERENEIFVRSGAF